MKMNPRSIAAILLVLAIATPLTLALAIGVHAQGDLRLPPDFDMHGPKADKLIIVVLTTQEAQMLALKKGEIDVLGWPGVPPTQVADLMKEPNIKLLITEPGEYYPLVFNCREYPFNITDFRRALAHAINKEELVRVLLLGYGRPARSCLASGHGVWFNPNVTQYEFNLTKAKMILERLGFKDTDGDGILNDPRTGKNLREFTIMIPSYDPLRIRMAQMICGWFKQIGVPCRPAPTEHGTMIDLVVYERKFDMVCWTYGWWPPWEPISLLYSSKEDYPGGWNDVGYKNKSWDKLIDEILKAPDMETLKKLIWKFQEWHAQEIPDYPLFERYLIDAYRTDKLEGWVPMKGAGILNFWSFLNVHAKGKKFGGVIRVPVLKEPKTLSPFKITSGWDAFVIGLIYDTLLKEDPNRNIIPWMAERYEVQNLPNGTQVITFYLRKNLKWHDGTPLTAEDVAFTFNYFKEHKAPPYEPYLKNMIKAVAVDKYTVKVYMNTTSVINLYNLGVQIYIIPKHIWEKIDKPEEYEPKVPIGSGPWKFVRWKHGEFIELEPFKDYFMYPPERKTPTMTPTTTVAPTTYTVKTTIVKTVVKTYEKTIVTGGKTVVSTIVTSIPVTTIKPVTIVQTQVVTKPVTVTVTQSVTTGAAPTGMYVAAVVVIVAIIAIAAVLALRRR